MNNRMKFIDLNKQYLAYKQEIDMQIKEVIDTTSFIMSPKVKELEEKLAEFTETKYAIACSSGTDALLLALMSYGIEEGDEIITTPFTFIATSEVIAFLKAKPVFVDIDPVDYNIDPAKIRERITAKTKGIIPVDIFGQCADYDAINKIAEENNLFVIEDAAQSLGAKYKGKPSGSLGDVGCTSFFPAKPFGCYGDGGMVFTNNSPKATIIKSLSEHGKGGDKYDHMRIGLNARLDSLQAAILLAKMDHFKNEIAQRQNIAHYYNEKLTRLLKTPQILAHNLSVYGQYSIQVENRDQLAIHLKNKNIPTAIHYPKPLHLQPAFSHLKYRKNDFPIAEELSKHIISLPMHPFLSQEEQKLIIEAIYSFFR